MQGRPEQRVPLTALLRLWAAGNQEAVESLTPLIYGELRRMAGARLREECSGHTLQPTELVHEAFLKLMDEEGPDQSWRRVVAGSIRRADEAGRTAASVATAASRNRPALNPSGSTGLTP